MTDAVENIFPDVLPSSITDEQSALQQLAKFMTELCNAYSSSTKMTDSERHGVDSKLKALLLQINSKSVGLSDSDKATVLSKLLSDPTMLPRLLKLAQGNSSLFHSVMQGLENIAPKNNTLPHLTNPKDIEEVDAMVANSSVDVQNADAVAKKLLAYQDKYGLSDDELQKLFNTAANINALGGGGKLNEALDDLIRLLGSNKDDIVSNLGCLNNVFSDGARRLAAMGFGDLSELDKLSGAAKEFYTDLAKKLGFDDGSAIKLVNNPAFAIALLSSAIALFLSKVSNGSDKQSTMETKIAQLGIKLAQDSIDKTNAALEKKHKAERASFWAKIGCAIAGCLLGPAAAFMMAGIMAAVACAVVSLVMTFEGDKLEAALEKVMPKGCAMVLVALITMICEAGLAGAMTGGMAVIARQGINEGVKEAEALIMNEVAKAVVKAAANEGTEVGTKALQQAGETACKELAQKAEEIIAKAVQMFVKNPRMAGGIEEAVKASAKDVGLKLLQEGGKGIGCDISRGALNATLEATAKNAQKEAQEVAQKATEKAATTSLGKIKAGLSNFTEQAKTPFKSLGKQLSAAKLAFKETPFGTLAAKGLKGGAGAIGSVNSALNEAFAGVGEVVLKRLCRLSGALSDEMKANFGRVLRLGFATGLQDSGAFSAAIEAVNKKLDLGDSVVAQFTTFLVDATLSAGMLAGASGGLGVPGCTASEAGTSLMTNFELLGNTVQAGATYAQMLAQMDMAESQNLMAQGESDKVKSDYILSTSGHDMTAINTSLNNASSILTQAINALSNLKYSANDGE